MRMRFDKLIKPELEQIQQMCNFTDEENEIFILRSRGKSITEISFEIGLSGSTVKRRLKSIIDKIERIERNEKTGSANMGESDDYKGRSCRV